jgi:hypothetical protein
VKGGLVYDLTTNVLKTCDGTNWNTVAAGSGLSGGTSGYLGVWTGATSLGLSSTSAGNQLYWDGTNHRLGIGTSGPESKLEIVNATGGTTSSNYLQITGATANNTNYPGISFKGGSLATSYPYIIINNGGYGLYLGGGTSGVATNRAGMTFDSVAGTSFTFGATNALQILPGGNVGIGVPAPNYPLDVNGTVRATAYLYTSDKRLKSDIETVDGLDIISRLHGVSFKWKSTGVKSTGVIAQEIEAVLPQAVATDADGMKSVDYLQLIGPMIEAIKTLKADSDNLRSEIETLKRLTSEAR